MQELLTLCDGCPRRSLEPGDVLLVDGQAVDALFGAHVRAVDEDT